MTSLLIFATCYTSDTSGSLFTLSDFVRLVHIKSHEHLVWNPLLFLLC